MSKSPQSFNNPGRPTLDDTDIAGVGAAVLTLARELWILNDRVQVLEAVLAEKGIDVQQEIESYQPNDVLQARLNEQSQALVEKVMAALAGD